MTAKGEVASGRGALVRGGAEGGRAALAAWVAKSGRCKARIDWLMSYKGCAHVARTPLAFSEQVQQTVILQRPTNKPYTEPRARPQLA